jgi:hypothetical protein
MVTSSLASGADPTPLRVMQRASCAVCRSTADP